MNMNPYAFPMFQMFDEDGNACKGMSLRDYFAAKAMSGILSNVENPMVIDAERLSKRAYEVADAMLLRRSQDDNTDL